MATQHNPRHLETALYHARILQHRKDVENKIFECLEKVIDYPLSEDAQSESPLQSEVDEVTQLLQLFRPADFEDLVDERRMAARCGYPLCAQPPFKPKAEGRYRIVKTSKGSGIAAVPKEKFESWCSPTCARRCVYLKGQLSNEPAWTRQEGRVQNLSFLIGDPKEGKAIYSKINPANSVENSSKTVANGLTKLAIRPKPDQSNSFEEDSTEILRPVIVERESVEVPNEPRLSEDLSNHDAIEGFRPGSDTGLDRKEISGLIG
jgi:hypothetical protein